MTLELVALGLDHCTANLELRERLSFAEGALARALRELTDASLLEQAVILSTCNRVELYGAGRSPVPVRELGAFLARHGGFEADELSRSVYVHRGDAVARHLAATTAGLHSLVFGEAQIQGQVRAALTDALDAGTAGPELRRLFESAIAASRRARSRTAIGRGIASIPQASVEFARQRLGALGQSTALLIGVGATSQLAAKQLVKHGVGQMVLLGRDRDRAERIAERYGARAITSQGLIEALARCDVAISATGAPGPVMHRHQLEQALLRRDPASRPLLLIDLAVPRDVHPSVAGLAGVELHTIEDLEELVEATLNHRRAELPEANAILNAEVMRYTAWLRRRELVAA